MSNEREQRLYSAIDDELTHYDARRGARHARAESVKVPAIVQYAWPHPTRRFLYVTTSNRGPGLKADRNHVTAFRIDPATGALTPHGEPQTLPHRATHMCLDPAGSLRAERAQPARKPGITVQRIDGDGTIGAEVSSPPASTTASIRTR